MHLKVTFAALVSLVVPCSCLGQSAREIARLAFRSVVVLETNDSDGTPLSLGSGFFVSKDIIATNAHVIEGASSGTARLVNSSSRLHIIGAVGIDLHHDLALLKVDGTGPPLRFGPSATPGIGDVVYVVGNPLGLEGTFSEGIISGVRTTESASILQMTAPISPGSSGGPVMDFSGAVIGVSVATFTEGQNLNLAVPVAYLTKLLASSIDQMNVTQLGRQSDKNGTDHSMVDEIATATIPKSTLAEIQRHAESLYADASYDEAATLFQQGCAGGERASCRDLGEMYEQGKGVAQNVSRAFLLYSKSCKAGDATGCDDLGGLYQEGIGVEKDYFRAFALYSKACNDGSRMSCNNLGTLYYDGNGVMQDRSRAAALYLTACDAGSPTGCKNLGGCYRDGAGVRKDTSKAKEYFAKSCTLGNQFGCDFLKKKH